MTIIEKNINSITPYERNPRLNDNAVDAVAASIREFGFKVPIIIDKDGVIVAGHTRLKAAKKLGLETVPCVIADDLNEDQIKAFRLADNKVSEFAEWDLDLLDLELADIDLDMEVFGFLKSDTEDEEKNEIKGEVQFAEVLGEENNYIVLKFKDDVDWLQACTLFDIKSVKCYSTRKDGKISKKMQRIGLGRVIDGIEAIRKITGGMA